MSRTKELGELLRIAGYKMSHELMHDGFDGLDGQAVWEVKFERAGREHTFTFHNNVVARYFPRGRPLDFHHIEKPVTVTQLEANKTSKPMKPTYAACMCWLLSKARAVRDGESFEAYCAEYEWSPDNQRARAAYKDCQAQKQGLDRLGADYDGLIDLFEDY